MLAAAQPSYNATTAQFFQVRVGLPARRWLLLCLTPPLPHPRQIPITSLASGSTTALNYLELLGVQGAIKVLDMTYVTSPCLQRLAECGQITHASSASVDYMPTSTWLAATSGVQMVLTDAYGTGATYTARDVSLDASFDMGLQARGEWIKFVSLFFNAEATANTYYASLSASLSADLSTAQALLQAAPSAAPSVAFVAYNSYESGWQMYNATYKTQIVASAGGVFAPMPTAAQGADYTDYAFTYGALFTNVTAFKAALRGVQVLVDETASNPGSPQTYTWQSFLGVMAFTPADLTSGAYPFLTNSRVFRYDKAVNDGAYGDYGLDWFANAVSQPQLVVNDFLTALYPDTPAARAATTTWLRNLALGQPVQVVTSAQCGDASGAISTLCGGPSAYVTLPRLNVTTFTPTALQTAVLALLPAGTAAQVAITDFPIAAQLSLSGPSLSLPQGTLAFLGGLGLSLGFPVVTADAYAQTAVVGAGRRLLGSLSLNIVITGLGKQAATAAALLATLGNSTALLAAAQAAGATGTTGAQATNVQVSAVATVTVTGTNANAGLATLNTAVASGSLNTALVHAGVAQAAPPSSSASLAAPARAATLLAAVLVAALAL